MPNMGRIPNEKMPGELVTSKTKERAAIFLHVTSMPPLVAQSCVPDITMKIVLP